MISLINKNQIINVFFLLPYAVILRIYSFRNPTIYSFSENDTVLSRFLINLVGQNSFIHSIIACLLCYIIAILMAYTANNSRIFNRQNLYPAIFFLIFSSFIKDFQMLTPALISTLFVVLFYQGCVRIYRNHFTTINIFNIGLFAALSSLTYIPFSILIFVSLVGLAFFKAPSLRDYLKVVFGVLAVFLITQSIIYFFDATQISLVKYFGKSEFLFVTSFWSYDRMSLGAILLLSIIVGILNYDRYQKKKVIDARKKISFLYILMVFFLSTPFLFSPTDVYFFLGIAVISTYFLSLALDYSHNSALSEMIHLILLLILFGFQFNLVHL